MLTFEEIRKNEEIRTYIEKSNEVLGEVGITEHGFAHVAVASERAAMILQGLGYDEKTCTLAKIAGYMHDIGNLINRNGHAHHGAAMAFQILSKIDFTPEEIAQIVSAIGHHDEKTAFPVSPIAAALIIADKSDVRRSRVRKTAVISKDIHDRVNYAARKADLELYSDKKIIVLQIDIDTGICAVMDYFEIFLERMVLCRKAAEKLGLNFELIINHTRLL